MAFALSAAARNFSAGMRNGLPHEGHESLMPACFDEIFSDAPHLHLTRMAIGLPDPFNETMITDTKGVLLPIRL